VRYGFFIFMPLVFTYPSSWTEDLFAELLADVNSYGCLELPSAIYILIKLFRFMYFSYFSESPVC
jgi:hypothetical protein